MAKRQEVIIEIDPATGDMSADVTCGPGGSLCETMIKELLDMKATSSNKKPEYYQKRVTVGRTKVSR